MYRRRALAYRPGTQRNHASQFKQYIAFCHRFQLQDIDPSPDTICLYIEFLASTGMAPKSIKNYVSAIKLLHKYVNHSVPAMESFHVQLMLRSLHLTIRHIENKRLPVDIHMLKALVADCDANHTHTALVLKVTLLFAFFGFLRQSNIAPRSATDFDATRHT
jgi:hypothetical protein